MPKRDIAGVNKPSNVSLELHVTSSSPLDRISKALAKRPVLFAVYASCAAFLAYFSMYGFRKPFSAATYEDTPLTVAVGEHTLEAKTLFVTAQIIGYCVSKYLGVRLCSEVRRERLGVTLIGMILFALITLVLFAVLPPKLKVFAIFLNGLPLGVVWGLIVRYLEGRRTSELLFAALSSSYILASGEVKRLGLTLMEYGVPEYWMPAATAAVFLTPFALAVGMLSLLPGPSAEDITLRSERSTMGHGERHAFLKRFLPGLIPLIGSYILLTAYRDFRDNYQTELFMEMGIGDPAAFSRTERPIAFVVILVLALIFLIRNNRAGLTVTYGVMLTGLTMMGGSTWAWDRGMINGEVWMIGNGLGAYLAYVPFSTVLFDRTIALTRFAGTAVFAIYVADALGYTGSVSMQLYKDLFAGEIERLDFFRTLTYTMSLLGLPLIGFAMIYFTRQKAPES